MSMPLPPPLPHSPPPFASLYNESLLDKALVLFFLELIFVENLFSCKMGLYMNIDQIRWGTEDNSKIFFSYFSTKTCCDPSLEVCFYVRWVTKYVFMEKYG